MKRFIAGVILLALAGLAVYGYTVTRREQTYRALIGQGDAAVAQGSALTAIEAFSGAIALNGTAMIGYLKRGDAYRRRGDLEPARRDLLRAAELDPTAARPRELLGDVEYAQKRYARAVQRYREYVRLDDRSPRVLYKLALAQFSAGDSTGAIGALRQAIAIDDRFAEAYYLLGLCLRDRQQPDGARRALERSVALAPATLHAREELADLYGAIGRTDDRLAELEALSALDAGPSREVTLGLAYARAGQPDRAVLTLSDAARRYPDHTYTYVALGRVWLERARAGGGRIALRKALGALQNAVGNDDSSEAMMLLGRVLLMLADNDSAERVLREAAGKQPADPAAFYYLADAAERLHHWDVARQALLDYATLRGVEREPRHRAAEATRLGDLSLRLGDADAAVGYFQHALVDEPGAALLPRLADAEWRAGEKGAARATLAQALEKDPRNPQALALRARFRR
ncbi:MAG TPA: tetratricopeptide repeat protein [Vicinamibacterales bacterium]|nr:tetratricopeptide repeat protein [Vicinamibacterales bacterium]